MSLSNEVAVMIGGTCGIGFASAQELASQRANILITGRPADKLNAAVESLGDDVEGLQGETSIVADHNQFDGYIKTNHLPARDQERVVARLADHEHAAGSRNGFQPRPAQ